MDLISSPEFGNCEREKVEILMGGFSSSVYGFSLALQVRIWCIKSWEMGSYIVETATKKVTKLSHVFLSSLLRSVV